ncbi:transcription termination factor 3, mitochondrial [Manduca sexta]|uniref:Transcription termination factor 3, mitochondrial n=1 Tax=Manduca sexta TaxID=7130 RepID=A0A921YUK4_MANSE|nr:transcription termination factor 3, mitochondrial [Manduca sexta]KAG6446236.1 hypothetical protein O3G_MSEX004373 [Manduca sexta]
MMSLCTYVLRGSKLHNLLNDVKSLSSHYVQTQLQDVNESSHYERDKAENLLQTTNADLSNVTPYLQNTFNIAAYVNKSETLKQLVKLNVNLSVIEKKPYIMEKFLKLDFERNMKCHIIFLSDLIGMENIGEFISKNPMIFYEPIEHLKVRINYLQSKGFMYDQINRIVSKNPFWLNFSTIRIDRRFGFFQQTFDLNGNEVRYLATKLPKLITYNIQFIKFNYFAIKEEFGFEDLEIKKLLLDKPKIWMINQKVLGQRFNYIHNIMKISHSAILESPEVLLSRNFRIKQRHMFLEKLGRAQYDPKKENYIPVKCLIEDTDVEFCKKYAKSNVDDFNMFLKTL